MASVLCLQGELVGHQMFKPEIGVTSTAGPRDQHLKDVPYSRYVSPLFTAPVPPEVLHIEVRLSF